MPIAELPASTPAFLTRGLLISVTVVDKPKVRSFDSGVGEKLIIRFLVAQT
jgi:hypothetical protein